MMGVRRWIVAPVMAAVSAVAAGQNPVHAGFTIPECPQSAYESAFTGADLGRLRTLAQQISENVACDADLRLSIRSRTAARLAEAAAGLPEDQRLAALAEAATLGDHWKVWAQFGDLQYTRKQFADAQSSFERALTAIDDQQLTPVAPSPETIKKVRGLAVQARLLAATPPQPSPTDRAGAPSGLALTRIRGVKLERAPVPVRFVYDQARFTETGQADAAFLRHHLQDQGDPTLILIGHTDPKGEEAYNCRLSRRRAQALADFLRQSGYRSTVTVVAMGEGDPFEIHDRDRHTESEIHQLLRRVEFHLPDDPEEPRHAQPCP